MKILFQNRDPKSWLGGDMVQLEHTRKALEKIGIKTDFSSEMIAEPEKIMDAEIVHCFNFSLPWTKYQIWNAKKLKKKVVCSMIYHETERWIDYKTQQAMVNELDACIFLTPGEVERARRHLDIPDEKIYIIPNGIEKWWFEPTIQPYGEFKSDVLTVGRIDENKGQLAVAKVCAKLGLHYKVIGESSEYAKKVANELGVEILPPMDQKLLKLHYAGCRVFALVSEAEVMPLTVMEAGSQGRPIVLTKGCEWQIPVFRATFNDKDEISQAISNALAQRQNLTFKRQLEGMTWENVANELKKVYE